MLFYPSSASLEILISNKHRAIREPEIEAIQEFFLKRKIDRTLLMRPISKPSIQKN